MHCVFPVELCRLQPLLRSSALYLSMQLASIHHCADLLSVRPSVQAASMYMELRPEGGARIHKVLCTHMDRTSSKPLSVEEHSPAPSRANSGEPSTSPYGRCCLQPSLHPSGKQDMD